MSRSATEIGKTYKERPLEEREKLTLIVQLLTCKDVVGMRGFLTGDTARAAAKYVLDKTMDTAADRHNTILAYWGDLFGEFRVYRETLAAEGKATTLSTHELGTLSHFIDFARKRETSRPDENSP